MKTKSAIAPKKATAGKGKSRSGEQNGYEQRSPYLSNFLQRSGIDAMPGDNLGEALQEKRQNPPGIQAKLKIGTPDDKYEQEADEVADKVVSGDAESAMANPGNGTGIQRQEAEEEPEIQEMEASEGPELQEKCADCEAEEKEAEAGNDAGSEGPEVQQKCSSCGGEMEGGEGEAEEGEEPAVQQKCAKCAAEETVQEKSAEEDTVQEQADDEAVQQESGEEEEETLQQKSSGEELVQEKSAEEDSVQEKSKTNKPGGGVSPDIHSTLESTKNGGEPLSPATQSEMGNALGHDMSSVRVHTNRDSVQMNQDLNARAFTHKNNVYFNEGEYNPNTSDGKKLLAHELTHTVQQGAVQRKEKEPEVQQQSEEPEVQESAEEEKEVQATLQAPAIQRDACEEEEESSGGSEQQAEEAQTATPGEGDCTETNGPAEEPPEGTDEPDDPEPNGVEANEGANVDDRQSNAPPVDEGAPEGEEGISEDAEPEEQGPCADQAGAEGEGGAEGGGEGGGGAAAGAGAGANAGQEGGAQGAEGPGAEGGQNAEGGGEGGEGGEKEEGEAGFLQEATAQPAVEVNPEGKGEAASPEVAAERNQKASATDQEMVSLNETSMQAGELAASGINFLEPEEDPAADPETSRNQKENHQRAGSQASTFVSKGVDELRTFIEKGISRAESMRSDVAGKKARLQAEIRQKKAQTKAVFMQLENTAKLETTTTLMQLEIRHATALGEISTKATAARELINTAYQAADIQLLAAYIEQIGNLNTEYRNARTNHLRIGREKGAQAMSRARTHERAYRRADNAPSDIQQLVRNEEADGFWDGYLSYNRYMARADATKETGEQYRDNFQKEAEKRACKLEEGKPRDLEFASAILEQSQKSLGCAKDNALEAIGKQEQAAIMQATHAKQEITKTIQDSLNATLTQLKQRREAQMQLLNDYGTRQEVAIERDAENAVSTVLKGVGEAAGKVLQYLSQFKATIASTPAPESEELSAILDGEEAQFQTNMDTAEGMVDQSMSQAKKGLDDAQAQASSALRQLHNQGITDGRELGATFSTTLGDLLAGAMTSYDELIANYNTSIDGEVENGRNGMNAVVDGTKALYQRLAADLKTRFDEAAEQMGQGFQTSLDEDFDKQVCAEAEKAASDVKPWWQSALKILLVIVVIVVVALVVGPAVIGAVGAFATSLAGSLGAGAALAGTIGAWAGPIIGGAIVGALAGATIQVGNNLIDIAAGDLTWDDIGKGVWGAVIAGAIGGALGGLGGQFAQVIMGRLGAAGLSAGWQAVGRWGVEQAFDVVGTVLGDLAAGNPITLESILTGLAIGNAVQFSMSGVSGIAGRSARIRGGAGADVNVSGSTRPRSRFDSMMDGIASTRLGRAAEWTQGVQSRYMQAGEAFGHNLGARGGNAPTLDATRGAMGAARQDIEDGNWGANRETTADPEGWGAGRSAIDAENSTTTRPEGEGEGGTTREQGEETTDPNRQATHDPERIPEAAVNEAEPPVRYQGEDGHTYTVTKDGLILRCSDPCDIVFMQYRDLIHDNPSIQRDLQLARNAAAMDPPNAALSEAHLRSAMDALSRLRNLDVTQRLSGVVDDINAQNGLARLAQNNNQAFTHAMSSLDPAQLAAFGRFLEANPSFARSLANAPEGFITATGSSHRVMKYLADNPSELGNIRGMYDDYIRPRPAGQELKSTSFDDYLASRQVPIGSELPHYGPPPRQLGTRPGDEGDVPRTEPVEIEFKRNPDHSEGEFLRQLQGQQDGLNRLTVEEYMANRDRYLREGRASEGAQAQEAYRQQALRERIDQLIEEGNSPTQARQTAEAEFENLAALHDPDQVAGGNPLNVTGMGDSGINSSLGSQWDKNPTGQTISRAELLDQHIRNLSQGMTPEQRANTFLHVVFSWVNR